MRTAIRIALLIALIFSLAGCFGGGAKNVDPSQTAAVAPPTPTTPPAETPAATPAPEVQPVEAPSMTAALKQASPTEAAPGKSRVDAPSPSGPAPKPVEVAALDASPGAPKSPTPAAASASAPVKPGKHIAVVGDSLAVGVGMTMEKNLQRYEDVACTPMGKVSTGLIAKRKYDWEGALENLVREKHPDAVVVVMGGNDSNNNIGGKAAGSDAWKEAYSKKVKSFLKIAADAGVLVYWAGLPIMRDESYSKRVEAANDAAKNACRTFSNCIYIDSWAMFADADGRYAAEKANGDGKVVSLRAKDGVHLTMTGYDYLCREILDKVAQNVDLHPKSKP